MIGIVGSIMADNDLFMTFCFFSSVFSRLAIVLHFLLLIMLSYVLCQLVPTLRLDYDLFLLYFFSALLRF